MRTLLNLIGVTACLAAGACSNGAAASGESALAVERTPVATPEPSAAKNDDAKSASCNELRTQLDAQKNRSAS